MKKKFNHYYQHSFPTATFFTKEKIDSLFWNCVWQCVSILYSFASKYHKTVDFMAQCQNTHYLHTTFMQKALIPLIWKKIFSKRGNLKMLKMNSTPLYHFLKLICFNLKRLFYRRVDGSDYKKSGKEGLKLESFDKILQF